MEKSKIVENENFVNNTSNLMQKTTEINLIKIENLYWIEIENEKVPLIEVYQNKYHNQNAYLRFLSKEKLSILGQEYFKQIASFENKNLQVMIESTKSIEIEMLQASGFKMMRKCYEVNVNRVLFKPVLQCSEIVKIDIMHPQYNSAAKLIYDHYKKTHELINPLTIDFEAFKLILPTEVFIAEVKGKILHAAFIEDNEIAYVASQNGLIFSHFICAVINQLFEEYDDISFEVDSTDDIALKLLRYFDLDLTNSFVTWIYQHDD